MKERIALIAGPLIFAALALWRPAGMAPDEMKVAGVVAWMLTWWITECVPMAVTALLPVILFPLIGIQSIEKTCLNYGNRYVFLFLGGFVIALALEKWNLHRRLALGIVYLTGSGANRIIFGFFLASFILSMWISNTASTLLMLPIAASVVKLLVADNQLLKVKGTRNFATAVMLSIAYGASIGGISTLVGSPPNANMAGILQSQFSITVSFFDWMIIGLPFALVLLLVSYYLLVHVLYPNRLGQFEMGHQLVREQLNLLGRWTSAQKRVFLVFILTATLWIAQDWLGPLFKSLGVEFTDVGISLVAATSLFLLSSGKGKGRLLVWSDTERLPWGILLMFGGGLALADAFASSGLVNTIVRQLAVLDQSSPVVALSVLCAIGLFLTALMSNLAMVSIFVPVVGALAVARGISPVWFAIPVTMAASCDFMFPMSTPPNAIAYSSGYVKARDMLKAGVVLNLVSFVLLTLVVIIVMALR